jgi:hypothetical protein
LLFPADTNAEHFQVLQQQKRKVQTYTLNPKAISRIHLLGLIDPATREWTDGVLTKIARLVVSDAGNDRKIYFN